MGYSVGYEDVYHALQEADAFSRRYHPSGNIQYCRQINQIMVGKSVLQWSKADVVRSHGHLPNAFPPTVCRKINQMILVYCMYCMRPSIFPPGKSPQLTRKCTIAHNTLSSLICKVPQETSTRTLFTFRVTFISVNFDSATWLGILKGSVWGIYFNISRAAFWHFCMTSF